MHALSRWFTVGRFGCSMCESDSLCAACSNLPQPNYNQNNSSHYYDNSPSYTIDDLKSYDAAAGSSSIYQPATGSASLYEPATGSSSLYEPATGSPSYYHPVPGSLPLYHPAPGSFSSKRTLQSQSYLTYIQGLRLGSQTMSDWSRELAPSGDLVLSRALDPSGEVVLDPTAHISIPPWLEKLYSNQQTPRVDSLCALRDFMLQEALNVVKFA